MRPPPFHRRILPWIFFLTFLGVAPALVFYTAGYRWNPKKAKIERFGTVIIDSVPTDAAISIDGRAINKQTPVTLQNMPPGLHQFEITKPGYYPWKKSLDVFPEYVTFANDIFLWRESQPVSLFQLSVGQTALSPDGRSLLFVSASTTGTEMRRIDLRGPSQAFLTSPHLSIQKIRWSPNASYALLEPTDSSQSPWLVDTSGSQRPLELPSGQYRWENDRLVGNEGSSILNIRLSDFSVSRTTLPFHALDQMRGNVLLTTTGTRDIAFVEANNPSKGFLLPNAPWNFWLIRNDLTMLRANDSWLALIKQGSTYRYHTAQGDALRENPSSEKNNFLLIHGNELWLWDPSTEPELLRRQSTRMVDATWHTEGNTLFYATDQTVTALNLDPRSGRIETELGRFDQIYSLAYSNKKLYLLATLQNSTGIWTLTIE